MINGLSDELIKASPLLLVVFMVGYQKVRPAKRDALDELTKKWRAFDE